MAKTLGPALLAGMLLGACGGDDGVDPLSLAVDEAGPFSVGMMVIDVTYDLPGASEPRTIPVSIWYPTEDTTGRSPRYADLFQDNETFIDATPAAPIHDGGYPVHAYSHGHQGFAGTSSALMRYFVSHGWVAVAPDHVGDVIFDPEAVPLSNYYARPLDISRAIDALDDVELAGPIATDRVFLSGHSRGVFTVWAGAGAQLDSESVGDRCENDLNVSSCEPEEVAAFAQPVADPRVVAAMPMAGGDSGFFGATGYDAVQVPVLLQTGTEDPRGADVLFDAVDVDLTWVDVTGGCHQLFALGGCSMVSDEEGFAIVNTLGLAFARVHLLSDPDPAVTAIIDGTAPVSPRATYRVR